MIDTAFTKITAFPFSHLFFPRGNARNSSPLASSQGAGAKELGIVNPTLGITAIIALPSFVATGRTVCQ